MSDLYLRTVPVGPMQNFAYLLGSKSAKECFIVDPAWDIQGLTDQADADGMRVVGALVTHFHPDHCGGHLWGHDIEGVAELVGKAALPVYAHRDEIEGIVKVTGLSKSDLKPLASGDNITIGGVTVTPIHTPGHTPGSQCFLCENHLISGDTLFVSGCGRTDLPGGDAEKLYESLSGKLAPLAPTTILHPGHNYDNTDAATLAEVAAKNPFLTAPTFAHWRRLMGVP